MALSGVDSVGIEMSQQPDLTMKEDGKPELPKEQAQKAQEGIETVTPDGYLDLLAKLRRAWKDQPDLAISWANLQYQIDVPLADTRVQTLPSAFVGALTKPFSGKSSSTRLQALAPSSGVILPGTMTLILAAPGHGKTTLLKALAGRLSHDSHLTGDVRYNGLTRTENEKRGIYVSRLCAYVAQQDLHFPILTVRETFRFAAENSIPDPALLRRDTQLGKEEAALVDDVAQLEKKRADLLIGMLGMTECADTIVGNDLMRGISGGQRKRVTIGEMLLTNSRCYMLDEVTTGLDAAVTLHIFAALKKACAINNASVVTALLQPTPETYELFDNVILLREGHIVYHGPRTELTKWMWETIGLEVPAGVDEAGFIVDYLTDPHVTYEQAMKEYEARLEHQNEPGSFVEEGTAGSNAGEKPTSVPSPVPEESVGADQSGFASIKNQARLSGVLLSQTPDATNEQHQSNVVTLHLDDGSTETIIPVGSNGMHAVALQPGQEKQSLLANGNGFSNANGHNVPISLTAVAPKPRQLRPQHSTSMGTSMIYHSQAQATPVYESEELAARYHKSPFYTAAQTEIALAEKRYQPMETTNWSAYTKAQFAQHYPHSGFVHMVYNMRRQSILTLRNRTMIPPRVMQAIIMGIVIGTLFLDLSLSDYQSKMGLLLYVIMFGAFANLTELPVASEARNVIAKQIDAGFFPSLSYSFSVCICHLPITIIEAVIFGLFVYWMPDFTPDAGRFFFFLLVAILNSNAISVFFRGISYVAKNPDVARQMDLPFIIIFVIFGGFLIVFKKIPVWLQWLFYVSPFSWSVRSLAQNEFHASRYDTVVVDDQGQPERSGDFFLDQFDLTTVRIWKWMGVVYLLGWYFVFAIVCTLLVSRLKPITPVGTRRAAGQAAHAQGTENVADNVDGYPNNKQAVPDGAIAIEPNADGAAALRNGNGHANGNGNGEVVHVKGKALKGGNRQSFQLTALPFTPVTLSWRHINYSVEVVHGKKKHTRMLLNDISGYAAPGQMTALMGSSGAGKTTLMDVVAGRKTMGTIEGEILVNGHPKEAQSFDKLTGYVEQNDIHVGTATVREALLFSAKMRLPVSVTREAREKFVDEVMVLVGLQSIGGRMIGDTALPGLSPGQLKLVTIGVELVANPSVIFLDEPTSGLDAPSAARVMKAVRRIAATGRTVLCTIHQPSEELFLMFDRLLLLKTGGRDVFFGDTGRKASNLVNYFEAASDYTEKLPRGSKTVDEKTGRLKITLKINPANWMLDVIGAAGNKGDNQRDYATIWRQSELFKTAQADAERAATPAPGSHPVRLDDRYIGKFERYWEVQYRLFVSHWRNPPMNLTRLALILILSIVLGIIYLQLSVNDFAGVSSMLGVIFLGLSFPSSVVANSPIPSLFRTRAAYYREKTIGLYGYKTFMFTIFIVELPYLLINVLVFLLPYYFLVGMRNSFVHFARFYLMSLLMGLTYSSLSQLWLALCPNQIVLNVLNGLFMSLFMMFGGMFIKPSSIPSGWKWFYYIDPVPKAFTAVAMDQFYCEQDGTGYTPGSTTIGGCPAINVPINGATHLVSISDFVQQTLDASKDDYDYMVGWLFLTIFVIRILNLICLKYVSHIKR